MTTIKVKTINCVVCVVIYSRENQIFILNKKVVKLEFELLILLVFKKRNSLNLRHQ